MFSNVNLIALYMTFYFTLRISKESQNEWILFLEDHTRLNVKKLLEVLDSYNSSQVYINILDFDSFY